MDQSLEFINSIKYFTELIYKEIEGNMWTIEELKSTFLKKCSVNTFMISLKALEMSGKIEKRILMGSEFYTITIKKK